MIVHVKAIGGGPTTVQCDSRDGNHTSLIVMETVKIVAISLSMVMENGMP